MANPQQHQRPSSRSALQHGLALHRAGRLSAATRRRARVVMEVQAPLQRLLQGLGAGVQVVGPGQDPGAIDLHCPMLSLPLAFGTTGDTVPADTPYLHAAPGEVAVWRQRLGTMGKGLRIGLTWSGNPGHRNDRNRSIPLAMMAPLLQVRAAWVSVQKDMRAGDAALLGDAGVACFANELEDFTDTAALIATLDLVIAVDTAVAHLAGALGRPVWLLLPHNPDWRWMLGREDSPWYPGMRLFRQPAPEDWTSVLARVAAELRVLALP